MKLKATIDLYRTNDRYERELWLKAGESVPCEPVIGEDGSPTGEVRFADPQGRPCVMEPYPGEHEIV